MRSVEGDIRLDKAVVSLMVDAQERMLTILTPPEAVPHQPLTLALLQARPATAVICTGCHACACACHTSGTVGCHAPMVMPFTQCLLACYVLDM